MFGPTRFHDETHALMPFVERVLAEVRAPGPAHDHGLDRVALGRDAELPVAVERDRPDVGRRQPVRAHEVVRRLAQLLDGERDLHVEQPRRVVQALHVVGKTEDGGAPRRLVAANALEDTGAVVEAVDADVDLRVRPVDELAVHPDLVGLFHYRPPWSVVVEWPQVYP